jgi:hypothetical protein
MFEDCLKDILLRCEKQIGFAWRCGGHYILLEYVAVGLLPLTFSGGSLTHKRQQHHFVAYE